MRKLIRLLMIGALFMQSTLLLAQDKTITVTVLDDADGTPSPGANVAIKGTQRRGQADEKGTFRLTVKNNDVLSVTAVGFGTREYKVGTNTILTIRMTRTGGDLNEVVVAMDIKRNPRE